MCMSPKTLNRMMRSLTLSPSAVTLNPKALNPKPLNP